MAKPLGPKSQLIRDAIQVHPHMGNKDLAEKINSSDARKEDRIEVSANDIAQQKQALKKAGQTVKPAAAPTPAGQTKRKVGRPRKAATPAAAPAPRAAAPSAGPVDLIDSALTLAQECGGFEQLKRLVDRLGEMRGR